MVRLMSDDDIIEPEQPNGGPRLEFDGIPASSPAHGQRITEPGIIVGIGASAGGLEAYRSFLSCMPADSGMAFVLVQHLAPDHKSMLAELLGKATTMRVVDPITSGHSYVSRRTAATDRTGRLRGRNRTGSSAPQFSPFVRDLAVPESGRSAFPVVCN